MSIHRTAQTKAFGVEKGLPTYRLRQARYHALGEDVARLAADHHRRHRRPLELLDVGCDRAGDALGSGIVQLMLWFGAAFIPSGLLGAMLALAAAGIWAASRLDPAYSGLVQQRLVDRAVEIELNDIHDSTTRSAVGLARVHPPSTVAASNLIPLPEPDLDPILDVMKELRSGDRQRVQGIRR